MKNHAKVSGAILDIVNVLKEQRPGRKNGVAYGRIKQSLSVIAANIEDAEKEHFAAAERNLAQYFADCVTGDAERDSFVLSRFYLTSLYRVIHPYRGDPSDFEAGIIL